MESKETLNINCTAVIEKLNCIIKSKTVIDKIGTDNQSKSISSTGLNKDKSTLFTEMELGCNSGYNSGYNKNLTYEIILSAILNMDYIINP